MEARLAWDAIHVAEMDALQQEFTVKQATVEAAAEQVAEDAATAGNAAAVAQASANFKGTWSSLVGALNKPASVHHNGAFWVLLNNLGNVAASEPTDISADWVRLGGLIIKDEGTNQSTAAASLNFIGDTVRASAVGAAITITIEPDWATALAI
ncbi:hypothetical protein ACFQUU_27125 [Herbaspirillum sp. GCM10030257]|uniref:hypothetical protein n=1 Tax=Herbaspirillum sp. GCM10030257 TaxID=3273393 RepID=UPI003607BAB6